MRPQLRIRQWMMIGMLIVLLLPRLLFEIYDMIDHYFFESSRNERQQIGLTAAIRTVSVTSTARWGEPAWQASLQSIANRADLGIILLDGAGREIFHSVPAEATGTAARQISVVEQGEVRGEVLFFVPKRRSEVATVCSILAAVGAILFIGWKMGRVVVKPLEAMSAAARRIADGNLDFHLPESSVLEVATVRSAFHAMGSSLRESILRQSELEEERRFFIGAIAHDLRTPLFTLRGYLARLEKGMANNPDRTSRYLSICSKKAEQLERLVSDLFSYTKLESIEQTLRPEPVEPGRLFAELAEEFRPVAMEKSIELSYEEGMCKEEVIIIGDSYLLRRAVGNLIDNAIRHTPHSGNITFGWRKEDDRIVFTIEDTGTGIVEQDLKLIFEPLYRGDKSRNPAYGGVGLGLTIARRIVRAHKGELIVQNRNLSGGAIFTGWVPLH
ncbi:HAMP domain-containing sensor histidine kinase [Brevibacillus choshinensis]|uniref:sensor histidine kinase n=1 Tax=Brevibacillus choshinensis TaxID=54911 RepID=UPI002E248D72|nr:HAMP domain-containing sensor histidine kinase [Brevibacillus choshinensis]